MNTSISTAILAIGTAIASTVAIADEPAEGFTSIFNGRDWTGWAGPVESYEIDNGILRCKPGRGGTIYTRKEYGDFIVRLEFRLPPGGNNGLAIRYPGKGNAAYDGMCELQVLDNTAKKYAQLDSRQYHGSVYGLVAAKRGHLRSVGKWNSQEVTVRGSTIRVVLNGHEILSADVSKVSDALDDRPHPGQHLRQGAFGFAGHNDPVEFRNIVLRELK